MFVNDFFPCSLVALMMQAITYVRILYATGAYLDHIDTWKATRDLRLTQPSASVGVALPFDRPAPTFMQSASRPNCYTLLFKLCSGMYRSLMVSVVRLSCVCIVSVVCQLCARVSLMRMGPGALSLGLTGLFGPSGNALGILLQCSIHPRM